MPTTLPGRRHASPGRVALALAILLAVALSSCNSSQTPPGAGPPEPASGTDGAGSTAFSTPVAASTPTRALQPTQMLPTQTVAPAPIQLTQGGCCSYPFWGPGSAGVFFLDRPEGGPLGTYRVGLDGGPPTLFDGGAALFSRDLGWLARVTNAQVEVVQRTTGDIWRVPSQGRMVRFSPEAGWVAWQIQSSNVANLDRRRWTLMTGSLTTHNIVSPLTGIGGGFIGWGQSGDSLLFSGRQVLSGPAGLWQSPLDGSDPQLIFPSDRIHSPLISPDGGWVALTVAFTGDQAQDGLWIVSTTGKGTFRASSFGAYRWRGEGRLVVLPLDNGQSPIRAIQVDADLGRSEDLDLPPGAFESIANNTWEISPDGRWVVYQSAADMNLWILRLPGDSGGA